MKTRLLKFITGTLLVIAASVSNATVYTIGGDATQSFVNISGVDVFPPGSHFAMFSPVSVGIGVVLGNPDSPAEYAILGTTEDITGSLDDSLLCFDVSCTAFAMTFGTAIPFSGTPWTAHTIKVFGPGSYEFQTCPLPAATWPNGPGSADGSTKCIAGSAAHVATLTVGPGKLGAQVLFDWGTNKNIDVILLWEPNAVNARPAQFSGLIPADTRVFELASRDVDGDGNPSHPMLDGPFGGHGASFSFFLDQSVAIPALPCMDATQGTNSGAGSGTIEIVDGNVTIDTCIAAAANLQFDWNVSGGPTFAGGAPMYPASDSALITAVVGDTASPTFVFDPSGLTIGSNLTASVRVTNTDNGLSHGATFPMQIGCPATTTPGPDTDGDGVDDATEQCADSDGDGILEYLDPASHSAQEISADLPTGTTARVDAGMIQIGAVAATVVDSAGNPRSGIGISATDISTVDTGATASCVGGCFDFIVTGGALSGTGTVASIVLPLTAPIPANAVYRKFNSGTWNDFVVDASNMDMIESALSVTAGVCPVPLDAAYTDGLSAGDDCVQLTIEDNGPNDADANAGTIADPGGVSAAVTSTGNSAPSTSVEGVFGCSVSDKPVSFSRRGDILLLALFITWLGFVRTRASNQA